MFKTIRGKKISINDIRMFSEHQQHNASTTHYTVQCEAPLHKTDFMVKIHQVQTMFIYYVNSIMLQITLLILKA